MPPKKSAPTGENGETGGKFVWEGANDSKLLLLTQGRYVKPDEYAQLSSAFPGTTTGAIRNRISALRVKQRDAYEQLGWSLPEGGAGYSVKKTGTSPAKKRTASEISSGGAEKPAVKKRAGAKGNAKGVEKEVLEESEEESDGVIGGD